MIDQQALAWGVGDENGLGVVGAGGVEGEAPGEHVLERLPPYGAFVGVEWLAPERPYGAHQFFFRRVCLLGLSTGLSIMPMTDGLEPAMVKVTLCTLVPPMAEVRVAVRVKLRGFVTG